MLDNLVALLSVPEMERGEESACSRLLRKSRRLIVEIQIGEAVRMIRDLGGEKY
jgi:hypothetical protein